ncbi:hypothetical protein HOLleu_36998 [Holothuria leucospilota]|uniref:Uncharacterized protein n=1 Tax=Holothuria leucospilota TaxID=206669 RepID=A0A9Q0YQ59_HOLLE|nr:hypothetical protein HOLleu_36998 [Holothuria leucospilota]
MNFLDSPWQGERSSGSTGLLFRETVRVALLRKGKEDSFEFSEWVIKLQRHLVGLSIIYRPPYSVNHSVTTSVFLEQFATYLESIATEREPLFIVGDVDIHINKPDDNDTRQLNDLQTSLAMEQLVMELTHVSGNILHLNVV